MAFNLNENSIGLDISDRSLRLVRLAKRGKKINMIFFDDVAIPVGVIENGDIKNEKKLIELTTKIAKKAKIKKNSTQKIISVLPETKTFITVINIPTAKTNEKGKKEDDIFSELVEQEIVNHIPLNLDEIYIDWQVLKRTPGATKLLIGAVPKGISDIYYSVLEKSGLKPHVLEIEAAPIIRSLLVEGDEKSKMIIDFGAIRTGLIIYNQKTVNFTVSLPISGQKITETIASTLKMDMAKAEEAKIVCGLDKEKCEGALLKVLMDPINKMASHIKRAQSFYQTKYPKGDKISEIILCGGGANFINIDNVLKEKVGLPVKVGDPLINIAKAKKIKMSKEKALSYTSAIGLALNAFGKK